MRELSVNFEMAQAVAKTYRPLLLIAFGLGGLFAAMAIGRIAVAVIDLNIQVSLLRSQIATSDIERTLEIRHLADQGNSTDKELLRQSLVAYAKAGNVGVALQADPFNILSMKIAGDTAIFIAAPALTKDIDTAFGYARRNEAGGWTILTFGTNGLDDAGLEKLKIPLVLR